MKQIMTASDLLRIYNNVMRRDYMREYMTARRARTEKTRICPQCEARELEKRHRLCSECRAVNDEFYRDISRHNWRQRHKGATA